MLTRNHHLSESSRGWFYSRPKVLGLCLFPLLAINRKKTWSRLRRLPCEMKNPCPRADRAWTLVSVVDRCTLQSGQASIPALHTGGISNATQSEQTHCLALGPFSRDNLRSAVTVTFTLIFRKCEELQFNIINTKFPV